MKLGIVNKLAIVNRFVFHALHRNITRLDITCKTTMKTKTFEREIENSQRFFEFKEIKRGCKVAICGKA